jgi:hypothetical protein
MKDVWEVRTTAGVVSEVTVVNTLALTVRVNE